MQNLAAAAQILLAAASFGQTPKKTGAAPAATAAKPAAPAASKPTAPKTSASSAPAPAPGTASKVPAPKTAAPAKSATAAAPKKSPAKKAVAKKKSPAKKATVARRRTQTEPSPDRYTEIQNALIGRGLLPGPATGKWGADSVAALKEFQASQKLEPTGKITALSLIRLGLGPKRDATAQGGRLPPSEPVLEIP